MLSVYKKSEKDLSRLWVILFALALLAVKLILASAQKVYLDPDEAVLDDMVMYNAAVSISRGNWLGAYGFLTLAKRTFFSLWLFVLHALRIPYLLGGQLLWAGASLAAAAAFLPALKKRWLSLALFALLLFNPASVANPAPLAYITRVYRDNIFPALCVLCVAGMVGFALRSHLRLRRSVWWLVLAGLAFGACWLTREDGWWLLPFVAAAAIVTVIAIVKQKINLKQKLVRCAALVLPFVILAGTLLGWMGMNQQYYGRFVLDDFQSGEFADAYGAMTRIDHTNWDPQVAVPREVIDKLYEEVPQFAELQPWLDSKRFLSKYTRDDGEYTSGAFYWALREAAGEAGYYDTPQKAQQYFSLLADKINLLCDTGVLAAGPARSSVSPPIRTEYVVPVLQEMAHEIVFCATFQQCSPYSMRTIAAYEEKVLPMEQFLHEDALMAARENSDLPYYSPIEEMSFFLLEAVRVVYSVLLPLALLAAAAWLILGAKKAFKSLKEASFTPFLTWMICVGVLCCILLRAAMIAFVDVSSFAIGTYVMYLASIHPLMIMLGFVGTVGLVRVLYANKKQKQAAAGEAK